MGNFSTKEVGKIERLDSVLYARCKRTTLATIVLYMEKENRLPHSLSGLVRESLEGLEQILISNGAQEVLDTDEATHVLNERGFSNLNPNKKGGKNLWNNLVFDERKLGKGTDVEIKQVIEKMSIKREVEEEDDFEYLLGIVPEGVIGE